MKKITLLSILALLLCVVSCQISGIENGVLNDGFKVTAVIDNSNATRVSYAVDNEAFTITPTWSVGDKIIGIDDKGEAFTFTVESLDGDKAVLNVGEYVFCGCGATKLFAFYAPGCTAAEIVDDKLTVNMNPQDGMLNDETKVLMSAVAPIVNGEAVLTFKKETAILGLKKFKLPVTEATTITSMDLVGVPSYGEFSVADDDITFTPGTTTGVITLKGEWTTDAEGVCTTPVYFSVAPQTEAEISLNMSTGSVQYANVTRIEKLDIEAGYYYHMTKVLGEPVAAVGDEQFGSINDAFAMANTVGGVPVTIKVLKDCASTDTLKLDNPEGIYTLDLNGKTVTTRANSVVVIENGSFTLTDNSTTDPTAYGTLTTESSNTNRYVINNRYNATFRMERGNVTAPEYRAVFFTVGSGGVITGDGKISTPKGMSVVVGASGGHVDIEGDVKIAGSGNVVYCYGGSCTITGGYVSNTSTSALVYAGGDGGSVVTVTGGYFKTTNINTIANATGCFAYVTGGCHSVAVRDVYAKSAQDAVYYNAPNPDDATKEEYPFVMVPAASNELAATTISTSNIWHFNDFATAHAQADKRSKNTAVTTLKLEKDLNTAETISFPETHKYMITVDLNGKKISSTASPALTAECPMTVQDSGENGEISTTGSVAVLGLGDLTVSGGAFVAASTAVAVADACALTINNGYFFGDTEDVAKGGANATVTIYGGWFKNNPEASYIAEGCASNAVTENHLEKTYNYKVAAASVVATVNGTGYATYKTAVTAANTFSGSADTVVLTLQADIAGAPALSVEHATLPVVLDLNGHTLASADSAFVKCQYDLTIVDNGATKGKITSSASNVICKVGTGVINLKGVTIECTKASAPNFYGSAAVYMNNSNSTLNVEGCKIYTTGNVAAVSNRAGTLTISDSEVTSGTTSAGHPALCNGGTSAITTVNSGSFVSTATSRGVVVNAAGLASSTKAGSLTINGGYFYATGAAVIMKGNYANDDHMAHIFVNGGYFSKTTVWTNGSKQYPPTYGEGKSEQTVDPKATYTHATTGQTYEYGFQVK